MLVLLALLSLLTLSHCQLMESDGRKFFEENAARVVSEQNAQALRARCEEWNQSDWNSDFNATENVCVLERSNTESADSLKASENSSSVLSYCEVNYENVFCNQEDAEWMAKIDRHFFPVD